MLELKCQENARAIAQQIKSSGSGSDVTVTQVVESGTKIATIGVDDVSTDLYAPEVAVTQVLSSGTKIATIAVGDTSTDLYCETVPTPETPISITADGVKTIGALLNELFALIDGTKIKNTSKLIYGDTLVYNLSLLSDTEYQFTWFSMTTSVTMRLISLKTSDSKYSTAVGTTVTDSSSNVPTANTTIEIIY